jgi:tRNA(Ile)-lysidine synthase
MRGAFLKHIDQEKLCGPNNRILLAVSGGIDSMVMLHLFRSAGFSMGVAHCNFQLRGKDSDGDEQFIEEHCRLHHIPFYVSRFQTNNYAMQNGISIQMAARDLRYEWFEQVRAKEGFDFIATAHHLNDSVETIIFNLVHGRGLDGLTGIAAKNGNVIRPLLFASRKEIEMYTAENGITWREDISNQKDDYKRNFIRHEIIPRLKEINPAVEEAISKSIKKNKGILEFKKMGLAFFGDQNIVKKGSQISILKAAIGKFENTESTFYEAIKQFGFSIEQSDQIISSLQGQSGKTFFSSSHQLVIDRKEVIISHIAERQQAISIEKDQLICQLDGYKIEMIISNDLTLNSQTISLDADKLKYPLYWRAWKEGDWFYPLGMSHRKKISDFLIDNKIPLTDKNHVTVLESEGEIAWVVGHRISDHFKITPETKRAIHFTLTTQFV